MSKTKRFTKKKLTITDNDFVMACRIGDFQANKDIQGRMTAKVFKNKKAYSRKAKNKKSWE